MSLYDLDFHAWGHAQADAIRRRSANELDWDNLAEEVESLSRQLVATLTSRYVVLILHLLKWTHQPNRRTRSWVLSADEQRLRIDDMLRQNPSLQSSNDEAFASAYRRARLKAMRETGLSGSVFPDEPEFTVQQARDVAFWPDEQPPSFWR